MCTDNWPVVNSITVPVTEKVQRRGQNVRLRGELGEGKERVVGKELSELMGWGPGY